MHAIGLAVWIIIMVQACAGFCSTRSPYFLGAVATLGSPATRGRLWLGRCPSKLLRCAVEGCARLSSSALPDLQQNIHLILRGRARAAVRLLPEDM